MTATPDLGSLRSAVATRDDRGKPWVVLGVTSDGCTALTATAWADPSTQDTPFVDITLDIEH
jgi:hypothetical protein